MSDSVGDLPMTMMEPYLLRWRAIALLALLLVSAMVQAEDWIYRIRPGETLSGISARYLKPDITAAQLQAHNAIEKDRQIPVGTEIRIPLDWLAQSPARAEIVFMRGDIVLYRKGVAAPVPLTGSTQLQLGDRLVSGDGGLAAIRFADDSRLLLGPASEIILDTLSSFGETGMIDTRLRVQRGRVESRVRPLQGEGSRYQIHTPAAVTMVRGTGFRVAVEVATGITRSEVTEGDVAVQGGGETLSVSAGFGTLVEPGKPPISPRKLLIAPDLTGLPGEVLAGDVPLQWPPLAEAVGYRVKLRMADSDDAVLLDVATTDASYTLQEQQPGSYELMVRGRDELGLEGQTALHRLKVKARPGPLPLPDLSGLPKVVDAGSVTISWPALDKAKGYRLRFGTPDGDVLRDITTQAPTYALGELEPGDYRLSISAIDEYGMEGSQGVHSLRVTPLPLAPPDLSGLPQAVEEGSVTLTWPALGEAKSYHLRIGTPDGDVLRDTTTQVPTYALGDLEPGDYRLSISAIDEYGVEGSQGIHSMRVIPSPLAPPDLSGLPQAVEEGSVTLAWPALDKAKSYHLRLGTPDGVVLRDTTTQASIDILDELQPGVYRLSISAIDEHGREGQVATHDLRVDKKPDLARPAPVLDMPGFGPNWIDFNWSRVDGAWSYRLIIDRDTAFQNPLFERIGPLTWLRLPLYWRGRVFVRVDALFETDPLESHSGIYRLELP